MSFPILEAYQKLFPSCSELIKTFPGFYQKKLWNELSLAILKFIYHPQAKGKITFEFYTEFVRKFERSIDAINLLKIVKQSIVSLPNDKMIEFLQSFEQKDAFTEQTKAVAQALRGNVYVNCDIDKCSQLINKISNFLQQRKDVDSFVYSTFYRFSMSLYSAKKKHKAFYTAALQFIAYTPAQQIEEKQKLRMLTQMAIACLISNEIYNFSQLLEQPLLLTLKESNNAWIYHLLQIFNQGNIAAYQKFIHEAQAKNVEIESNKARLSQKIRLMAFLQLAFNLPKNDRVVSFDVLARKCVIPIDEVETMIMKTMALNLVKGSIDQLVKEVTITWVAPKVLGKQRMGIMLSKFEQWSTGIQKVQQFVNLSWVK